MSAAASVARAQEALRVGRNARIVQHARLHPACDEDAAQLRFAVEDALATADFADCGRLILVRRLHLRALPPRAGPAIVARALEAAWHALATRAVAASHPQAGEAGAVYFASRFDARLAWLKRVALGDDVSAWYWAAALPELRASPPVDGGLAPIEPVVQALLQESAAQTMQALRAWPDEVVWQLAGLAPDAVNRRLLEVLLPQAVRERYAVSESPVEADAWSVATQNVIHRLARVRPLSDAATSWIAALWLAPHVPAARLAPQVRAVVRWAGLRTRAVTTEASDVPPAWLDAIHGRDGAAAPRLLRGARTGVVAKVPVQGATPYAESSPQPRPPEAAPATPARRLESGLPGKPNPAGQPQGRNDGAPALPWLAEAAASSHGGLLCLLNVLRSLRFESWLAAQPPAARLPFVHALLDDLLSACNATADDPQRAWLVMPATDADLLAVTRWCDGNAGMRTSRALRLWRWRLRSALRRHDVPDLDAVVRRRAWLTATATHIDVVFPLDEVDLRLRRQGLDSDPGWVPWFARIVAFHFVDAALLPQRAAAHGAPHG